MTLPYKIIVVCRGRALLCPLDPDKADVLFIRRSRTPPLRNTFVLLRTHKLSFADSNISSHEINKKEGVEKKISLIISDL